MGKKFANVCEIASVMYEADEAWRKSLRARKISDITEALSKKLSKETLGQLSEWIENS